MPGLWECEDVSTWCEHVDRYRSVVDSSSKEQLKELDRWFFDTLPAAIHAREPAHITSEELVKLVEWKLKRGKWRPRLLQFAQQQSAKEVADLSTRAFELLQGECSGAQVGKALELLCSMKGIGPATASAVLAAYSSKVLFMGDEALQAVLGERNYTAKDYLKLLEAMQQKAQALSTDSKEVSPADLEKALFVEAAKCAPASSKKPATASSKKPAASGSKKRKR